jgi:predicted Co/Zn/Cd cation transporter (cation efflux family)
MNKGSVMRVGTGVFDGVFDGVFSLTSLMLTAF